MLPFVKREGLLLVLAGAALAAILLLRRPPSPAPPPGSPRPPPPASPAPLRAARPAPVRTPDLRAALAGIQAEGLRTLRDRALAFPEERAALIALLRDPAAPLDHRRCAAAILGTLPGGAHELAAALRDGAVAGLERTVILATTLQVIEDGELFEREGQPYAMELAPGIWEWVRGAVQDAGLRATLASFLASPASELRLAAARVLRESLAEAGLRGAFMASVRDVDPEVAGEAAAALATWSRDAAAGDRGPVIAAVLDAMPGASDVVHFRLSAPLSAVPLSEGEASRIRSLAASGSDDARHFAVELMGRRLGTFGAEDAAGLPVLAQAALSDRSGEVREAAALALGRAAASPLALDALSRALKADADWEVRSAAVRSLARSMAPAARSALEEAARSDPEERVRRAAAGYLK